MFSSGILPPLRSSDRGRGTPLTSANLPSVDASESDFATQNFEAIDNADDDSSRPVSFAIPGESLGSKVIPALAFFGSVIIGFSTKDFSFV